MRTLGSLAGMPERLVVRNLRQVCASSSRFPRNLRFIRKHLRCARMPRSNRSRTFARGQNKPAAAIYVIAKTLVASSEAIAGSRRRRVHRLDRFDGEAALAGASTLIREQLRNSTVLESSVDPR